MSIYRDIPELLIPALLALAGRLDRGLVMGLAVVVPAEQRAEGTPEGTFVDEWSHNLEFVEDHPVGARVVVSEEMMREFDEPLGTLVAHTVLRSAEAASKFRLKDNMIGSLKAQAQGADPAVLCAMKERIGKLLEGWIWHSDLGLIFRVQRELQGLREGYERVFWPQLRDAQPVTTGGELMVSCEVPALPSGKRT